MELFIDKDECCGCHACYNVCPVNAVSMEFDSEGFLYPHFNNDVCINCSMCKNVCPVINKPEMLELKQVYACKAKSKKERISSTSGGVFAVLAKSILSENGIICGAVFGDCQEVFHVVTNDVDDLRRIKGSKYVQSRINTVYKEIKKCLEENRQVLFSGTPCQIAGLKCYLGREYDNLLCVDLICHGVGSPLVWQKYVEEISNGRKIKNIVFRNKHESGVIITDYCFENGDVISEVYGNDLYMKGYINNFFERPSCFDCRFKGINRCSDITLGDFWSAKEFYSEFYDTYGISAVIVHSKKGLQYFKKVSSELEIVKSDENKVSCWNECLVKSIQKNPYRELFFEKWNEISVLQLIDDLLKKAEKWSKTNSTFVSKIKNFKQRFFNYRGLSDE